VLTQFWNSGRDERTVARMKRFISIMASAWLLAGMALLLSAQDTPTFDIQRPTIVAFFAPLTQSELLRDPSSSEALADFQFYATRVRRPLEKAGVDFKEVYVRAFRVRVGKTVTTFRPVKVDVGYCFAAPGKKPRVEYGVITDVGLLQIANDYFGAIQK
jgi:hypothetical protein